MKQPKYFRCPDKSLKPHLAKIFKGEYDIPWLNIAGGAKILDIGANVGAYSCWALYRFPGSTVTAYEPDPVNARLYLKNVYRSFGTERATLHERAVTVRDEPNVTLYQGARNSGMHSLWAVTAGQAEKHIEVKTMHPERLPEADVIKVDAEGVEPEILRVYLKRHEPTIVSYEWHSLPSRAALAEILDSHGYVEATGATYMPTIGVVNAVQKELFSKYVAQATGG